MITGYLITVFGNVRVHNVTNPLSFVDMTSLQAEPNWGVKEADTKGKPHRMCWNGPGIAQLGFRRTIEAAIGLAGLSRTLTPLSPILARSFTVHCRRTYS